MDELTRISAKKLITGIKNKSYSCVDVMHAYLQRIDEVNPTLNALVQTLDNEQAMSAAHEADKKIASGQPLGKLHGLPITIKDHIKVKGFTVTRGSMGFKDYLCEADAPIVTKLKQEGAIIIGISNMPELGPAFETDNDVYGRTVNPYDVTKTPGGSSGGEAAIITSGGSCFGIGSDGGGSIRVPAHFSGITGIKPTQHLLSCVGNMPTDGGIPAMFYSPGPMARYVEDLQLVLPIISGWDNADPSVMPLKLDTSHKPIHEMKIAYLVSTKNTIPDPATQKTMENTIKALSKVSKQVTEIDFLDVDALGKFLFDTFFYAGDQGRGYIDALKKVGVTKPSATLQNFFDAAAKSEAFDVGELRLRLLELDQIKIKMFHYMQAFDAIVLPACATTAKPHNTTQANITDFHYTMVFNLLGWPATVVRCGEALDGLPVGVQIAAKPWDDYTTLAIAAHLEEVFGGWKPPKI